MNDELGGSAAALHVEPSLFPLMGTSLPSQRALTRVSLLLTLTLNTPSTSEVSYTSYKSYRSYVPSPIPAKMQALHRRLQITPNLRYATRLPPLALKGRQITDGGEQRVTPGQPPHPPPAPSLAPSAQGGGVINLP